MLTHPAHSSRKLLEVYHDDRRGFVAKLGLELYQAAGGGAAAASAAAEDSDGEVEDSDCDDAVPPASRSAGLGSLQPSPSLLPAVPAAPPPPRATGIRAPCAHLLSLCPPKKLKLALMLGTQPTSLGL